MSDYSDFQDLIKAWANRKDWTDSLYLSFVRMAEQYIEQDLRIDFMIQSDTGTISDRQVLLPTDYLAADLIRNTDGLPLRYKSRDEFYNITDARASGYYTIVGRKLVIGGTPVVPSQTIYLDYYARLPVFSAVTPSWLYTRYPALYMAAVMRFAAARGVEDERSMGFKANADEMIAKLNAQHLVSKASGSRVTRTKRRSFG